MILFLSGEHFTEFINYDLKKFLKKENMKKKQQYGSTKLMYTVLVPPVWSTSGYKASRMQRSQEKVSRR